MALGDVMYQLRIRDLREDRDLSQTQVAELLKVHQTTYSDYELGRLNVPVSALHALAGKSRLHPESDGLGVLFAAGSLVL